MVLILTSAHTANWAPAKTLQNLSEKQLYSQIFTFSLSGVYPWTVGDDPSFWHSFVLSHPVNSFTGEENAGQGYEQLNIGWKGSETHTAAAAASKNEYKDIKWYRSSNGLHSNFRDLCWNDLRTVDVFWRDLCAVLASFFHIPRRFLLISHKLLDMPEGWVRYL